MKILLTNDDGIYAEGIYALYLELKKIGQVTVVAPDSERSSVGHGITLAHPIWQKKVNRKGKFFGYGITGTPADCVKFATNIILKQKPDLVVSGINLGQNEGCSVIYSGTAAGAREGALLGIPSMAVSLATYVDPNFKQAAKFARQIAKIIPRYKFPKGSFLNVNVPHVAASKIKGIRITQQCMVPIHGIFKKRIDPHLRNYYWMTGRMPMPGKDLNLDTYALNHFYVTITPITSDTTDYSFLNEIKSWKIA